MQSALVFVLDQDLVSGYLFDYVEGRYRFLVSASAAGWAQGGGSLPDIAAQVGADLEKVTGRVVFARGRPLLPEAGDGNGVDLVAAVAVPRGSLRVAVVGAEKELAYDSAPRAVEGSGHEVCHTLCLEKRDQRGPESVYDALRPLVSERPDAILVAASAVGRGEDDLLTFGRALGALASEPRATVPTVVFAGSEGQDSAFRQAAGTDVWVERVAPLRPGVEVERIEEAKAALAHLHIVRWASTVPEYQRFASWLAMPPVARDLALGRSARFIATANAATVHVADLDRSGIGTFLATPSSYSSFRSKADIPWARLDQWLAADSGGASPNNLANLLLRPVSVPDSPDEVRFHVDVLRHLARTVLDDPRLPLAEIPPMSSPTYVVGTGRACPLSMGYADAALTLLDTLQPTGYGYLLWDAEGLLAPAGALAESQPRLAAELLLGDAAFTIGAYVAPSGPAKGNAVLLEVDATYSDRSALRAEVYGGSVDALPIPTGESVVLEVKSGNQLDAAGALGKRARLELRGSPLGVVLDARGRPVTWPANEEAKRTVTAVWRGGVEPEEVTEAAV